VLPANNYSVAVPLDRLILIVEVYSASRLNILAMLSLERKVSRQLDLGDVIEEFTLAKAERVLL